jgi:hypothetical protein
MTSARLFDNTTASIGKRKSFCGQETSDYSLSGPGPAGIASQR